MSQGLTSIAVREPSIRERGARLFVLAALGLGLLDIAISTASAEEKWRPIVSATSDDGVRRMAAPAAPLPAWNDPRYRSPPQIIKSYQVSPLPQGAWSPIITGALPTAAQDEAPPDERGRFVQSDTPAAVAPRAQRQAQATPQKVPELPTAETSATPGAVGADTVMPRQRPLEALPPDATPAQQYCFNTADSAADARFAWQAKKIKEMEAELEKRAVELEAKTEEYKKWLARRDEFSKKAQEKLVAFYAKMRPDAAALHFTAMDDESAAALLTKLEPKVASLVMAEIDPAKAAKIAAVISGAARVPPNRRPRPAPPAAQNGSPTNGSPTPAPQSANQPPQGDGSAATPDNRPRS